MNPYSLRTPKTILFGRGVSLKAAAEFPADADRIFVVSGSHTAEDPYFLKLLDALHSAGKVTEVLSGVSPEPPPAEVDCIVMAARGFRPKAILAVGGGSVIDAAKAAAAMIALPDCCNTYFSGEKTIPSKGLFFAAMPTTSGTGAEMTNNSVLTDPVSKVKKSLRSPFMQADLAIVDPDLTLSCPVGVSMASGLDAFVQAVESYTSPKGSSFSRSLAAEAAKKLYHAIPSVLHDPSDPEARSEAAEGSMLAGISFAQCGLGAVHGIAHPVGSLLKVPHGTSCAVLMTPVFEFNREACGESYAELGRVILGDSNATASDFVKTAAGLAKTAGIPADFKKWGLSAEHYDFIIQNCRSASMKSNPRYMSDDEVRKILIALS